MVGEGSRVVSLQNIRRDASSDPLCRLVDRVVRQMGVARRRLDVAVPEQLADHREGFAERQGKVMGMLRMADGRRGPPPPGARPSPGRQRRSARRVRRLGAEACRRVAVECAPPGSGVVKAGRVVATKGAVRVHRRIGRAPV